MKALAAADNDIPFYVAAPKASIDWSACGAKIPIEERNPNEVTRVSGRADDGTLRNVRLTPDDTSVLNPGFEVTPSRLVTGLITERGICAASREGLLNLYPEESR